MKTKLILGSLMVFILMLSGQQAFAQIDDSLPPWFKAPIELGGLDGVMKGNYTFLLPASVKKSAQPISASMSKTLMLPRSVKRLPSPITLKRDGKCYKIGCDTRSCSDCQLFWYDRNKDGKVQPKRELRCYCVKAKKRCEMRGKEVPCKK